MYQLGKWSLRRLHGLCKITELVTGFVWIKAFWLDHLVAPKSVLRAFMQSQTYNHRISLELNLAIKIIKNIVVLFHVKRI